MIGISIIVVGPGLLHFAQGDRQAGAILAGLSVAVFVAACLKLISSDAAILLWTSLPAIPARTFEEEPEAV